MSADDGGDCKALVEWFASDLPEAAVEIEKSTRPFPWLMSMSKRSKLESGESSSSLTQGVEYHSPGYFYEIDHSSLPLLAPAELYVLRVALVFDVEETKVTVKFPSLDSLRAFFEANAEKLASLPDKEQPEAIMGSRPDMDEEFSMTAEVAEKALVRRISCTELLHQGHLKDFWVAGDNEISTPEKSMERRSSPPPRWALRRKVRRCRADAEAARARAEASKENRQLVVAAPKPLKVPREMQGRWSNERYKTSQFKLYEIMKRKGARPDKLIPRSILREEARHFIGDTGLLDHLLKHMTDVVVCDNQRFRRRHNTEGVMEYWLEDASLLEIRKEAGVEDPTWVPPPGWKPGDEINVIREGMTRAEAAKLEELAQDVETLKRCASFELAQDVETLKSEMKLLLSKGAVAPLLALPAPEDHSQDQFKDAMRSQVETLKANIEELQNAYVQLHVLHQENAALLGPNIGFESNSNESIPQEILRRLERLEEDVHWKFEALHIDKQSVQTQLSNLWKAVMAVQRTVTSLMTSVQAQDDPWLGFPPDAIVTSTSQAF